MAKPFAKLRSLMREHDVTQEQLGRALNIGYCSVSRRMNCVDDWRISEMWAIMDYFNIPRNRFHEYFPAQGINEQGTSRPIQRRY